MGNLKFKQIKKEYDNNNIEYIDDFNTENRNSYYLDFLSRLNLYVITKDENIVKYFDNKKESILYFESLKH